ncbi:hypothetical protein [Bacillus altitudinis]|nr:hypothetical protein [Bacillus altitudinis]
MDKMFNFLMRAIWGINYITGRSFYEEYGVWLNGEEYMVGIVMMLVF